MDWGQIFGADAMVALGQVLLIDLVLAGDNAVGEAETRRAAAMLEAITGAEVLIPDGEATTAETFSYAPLDIAFPQEVLLALGISIASLAGAGVIKTNQATNQEGRAQDVAASRVENAQRRAATMGNQVATLESDKEYMLESMQSSLESMDGAPPTQAARQRVKNRMKKHSVLHPRRSMLPHQRTDGASLRWQNLRLSRRPQSRPRDKRRLHRRQLTHCRGPRLQARRLRPLPPSQHQPLQRPQCRPPQDQCQQQRRRQAADLRRQGRWRCRGRKCPDPTRPVPPAPLPGHLRLSACYRQGLR